MGIKRSIELLASQVASVTNQSSQPSFKSFIFVPCSARQEEKIGARLKVKRRGCEFGQRIAASGMRNNNQIRTRSRCFYFFFFKEKMPDGFVVNKKLQALGSPNGIVCNGKASR